MNEVSLSGTLKLFFLLYNFNVNLSNYSEYRFLIPT